MHSEKWLHQESLGSSKSNVLDLQKLYSYLFFFFFFLSYRKSHGFLNTVNQTQQGGMHGRPGRKLILHQGFLCKPVVFCKLLQSVFPSAGITSGYVASLDTGEWFKSLHMVVQPVLEG